MELPRIDGYKITGLIGEGGMGAVYEAWQVQPYRRVAIKLLRHGLMSPTLLRRFELEVEILGRIEHPAITRLYEAGTLELGGSRVPFFAMEFVEGRSITEYVELNHLSVGDRVRLLQRVVDGVHVAHQKGVIHRDMKPANILVDADGQPKILDFGVARIEQADVQITVSPQDGGGLLGTLPYMSPEQVAGRLDEVDVRSDVYSLGVIAFELLSGRRPYRIESQVWHEIARQIETQEPMRLGSMNKELRGDLDAIVAKAIEKNRDRRYPSASALSEDLQRFLDCRPIEARAPSLAYQTSKFVRRHKLLVGMGGLVVAALALGVALAFIGLVRARRAEMEARRAEQQAISESIRAQANLQQAMDAVDRFMTVVAQGQLKNIPAAVPIRRKLLEDAVAFYERFAKENHRDGQVQVGLDWALVRLAEIEALMGDTGESQHLLERKIETHVRRLEADPEHEESLRSLARGLDQQGTRWMAAGDYAKAIETFEQASGIKNRLVAVQPDNADYQREQARSLSELGTAYGAAGKTASAREAFGASQHLLAQLIEAYSARPVLRRDLARVLEDHAKVLIRVGQREQAAVLQQEAGTHYRRLADAFPDDEEFQRDYARYLGNSGEARWRMGDAAGALQALDESNRLYQKLAQRNPGDETYGRDYAINCGTLGAIYVKLRRQAEARDIFKRGIQAARGLVNQHAHRPDLRRDLARLLTEQGKGLGRRSRDPSATESIGQAIRLLDDLVEQYPDNLEYRLDLARTYEEWGCAHRHAGDIDSAIDAFEQSYQNYTLLMADGAENPTVLAGMAYCLGNWGRVLAPDEAQQKWREALAIWEKLVQQYPSRSNYQKALGHIRQQLDPSARQAGRIPENKKQRPKEGDRSIRRASIQKPEKHGAVISIHDSNSAMGQAFRLDARDRDGILSKAGQMAVVSGRLDHVRLDIGKNQWSFLNFSRTRKEFYGAIHRTALPALQSEFGPGLEHLQGKRVELTGMIVIHKGAPSIVLTRANQIRLVDENRE
jgi:tetratricopeptide (TPR) repeat protein